MRPIFRHIVVLALCFPIFSLAQGFELVGGKHYQKVKFQLINNLIIIPIEVNGSQLSFLLDSGVTSPILFNLTGQDSIQINEVTEVSIKGLGEGEPITGLSSKGNTFSIAQLKNTHQNLFVILDKDINYSPSLGIPVHGIIGYDLFRDFVVSINYANQNIKFYDPKYYTPKRTKRYEKLPLDIENKRAYLNGHVFYSNKKQEIPVRLLIDTGSSDAIWLFEDGLKGIDIPEKHYEDYLGKGLNGNIFGERTKVAGFRLGQHTLQGPKVAFPKMVNFNSLKTIGDRNGSIGGEVLKRFNIVFNYPKNELVLKRNKNFKIPFQYNMSGIELMHAGMRLVTDNLSNPGGVVKDQGDSYGNVQILFEGTTRLSLVPEIIVSSIRMGSPADEVGLQEGDLILSVNGKSVHRYKLQEVLEMLNEREGKRVKLVVERSNRDLKFSYVLKKIFE